LTLTKHNNIVVSMIPNLDPTTGYLPPGVYGALWPEIVARFGDNIHRDTLLDGLLRAFTNLASAHCQLVLLDGSFVSVKPLPKDYDAAWETYGVDPFLLDPVLLDFRNGRAAMKAKYGGELFPASALAASGVLYRDFFKRDRNGTPKGVLQVALGSLP
jgi:hypothetical protein